MVDSINCSFQCIMPQKLTFAGFYQLVGSDLSLDAQPGLWRHQELRLALAGRRDQDDRPWRASGWGPAPRCQRPADWLLSVSCATFKTINNIHLLIKEVEGS